MTVTPKLIMNSIINNEFNLVGSTSFDVSFKFLCEHLKGILEKQKKVAVVSPKIHSAFIANCSLVDVDLISHIENGNLNFLTFKEPFYRQFFLRPDYQSLFREIEEITDPDLDTLAFIDIDTIFSAPNRYLVEENICHFLNDFTRHPYTVIGQFFTDHSIASKFLRKMGGAYFEYYTFLTSRELKEAIPIPAEKIVASA